MEKYGRKQRVFAFSLADVADTEVPDEWHEDFYQLQLKTPNTYWLCLTKRPSVPRRYHFSIESTWLGTSIGGDKDMHMAHEIVKNPALLHWISYEPAIGPLTVKLLPPEIKWVVVGGESGHRARPFNIAWALDVIDACAERGISVFVKQLGLKPNFNGIPYKVSDSHGKILDEWPPALRIQEFPL